MKPSKLRVALAAGAAVTLTAPLHGQGYRLRVDTRYQTVAYRGYVLDSIPVSDAQVASDGSFLSPDGIAAFCPTGATHCTLFRPGEEIRGQPVVATLDGSVWGFGIPGLRVSAKARFGADLADSTVWPGTDPQAQLIEGFAEYSATLVTARAGRTYMTSRLGWTGFDGGMAEVRPVGQLIRVAAYGGWGLARGIALPVTSDALNPLDDFQPRERQLVAGAELGWRLRGFEGTVTYQREVDPNSDNFVSERTAFDAVLRPVRGITLAGGAYYDMAAGFWGTADATLSYVAPRGIVRASVGGRRYRPHFDLWTIWGAFSPVPYSAGFGTASVAPIPGLEVHTRAEVYSFDDAEADTVLVRSETDGWRWSIGTTFTRVSRLTVGAGYHIDDGPGAKSLGFDGRIAYNPVEPFFVSVHAERLKRPLEFRFNDATVWSYGLRLDYEAKSGVRFNAEVRRYDEQRDRADAAAIDWNQWRLNVGATVSFGSAIVSRGLHPAILRIPERRGAR